MGAVVQYGLQQTIQLAWFATIHTIEIACNETYSSY